MARRSPARKSTPPPAHQRIDTKYASLALWCGLLSWVPLLNLVIVPLGIVFGVMGVRAALHAPRQAGMVRAIVGLVICAVWLLMTLYAMVVFGPAALLRR